MANIFEFSLLNTVKMRWQSDVLPSNDSSGANLQIFNPSYNYKGVDDDFYYRLIKIYDEKKAYLQPYQQSDTIRLQWLSDIGTLSYFQYARLLDAKGGVYSGKTITVVKDAGTYYGQTLYYINVNLYDVPEGVYFIQLGYYTGSGYKYYVISEPFNLKQIHANTVRLEAYNSYNDQSYIYPDSSFVPQLRVHGNLIMGNDAKFNVYEDQPLNTEMVSGIVHRTYELTVGPKTQGVPTWIAEIIEHMTMCDYLRIDGKYYTRESGAKLEPKKIQGQPLMQYVIKFRERENTQTYNISSGIIRMGAMPQTNYFWVESINIASVSITVQKMFKGKRNFLDYLNCTHNYTTGYWSEDNYGQLVYNPNPTFTPSGAWSLSATNVLSYGLKFVLSGAADFSVDIAAAAASNFYAVVYNDGFANVNKTALAVSPSVTNVSKTYTSKTVRELYIFFSDAKSIADNATTITCLSVGGDLPPAMTYYYPFASALGTFEIENNLFNFVTALVTFNISQWSLNTNQINKLLGYLWQNVTRLSTSSVLTLSGQLPSAAPTANDAGVNTFKGIIKARVTTLNTD